MSEVAIGSDFAGYRVEALAAQGGMGRLYRATQTALKRPVALKVIVPELADDPDFRTRFERESELAASIDHPNVIPVYEAGEADGRLFIAMRWVEGTDLRSLIVNEGRLEPERAVGIVEQVADALDAAHSGGLVHRDVKPANVMLTAAHGREHAYLTDFGLTKRTSSKTALTQTGRFVGTPDYMPPEQISGEQADARADVYALGCMLFHMLTGRPPYERDSEVAKIYAHLNDPPPSLVETVPGTPPALDAVVARALAKHADDRYPSAGDLARAARAALTGDVPSQPERSLGTGPAAPTEVGAPVTELSPAATELSPAAPAPAAPAAGPPSAPAAERPRRRVGPIAWGAGLIVAAGAAALAVAGVFSSNDDSGGGDSTRTRAPRVAATIPVGDGPDGIAVAGSTVWVSNAEDNSLRRLSTASNKPVGRPVPVGRNPDNVVVGSGVVWVANTADGTVTRLDADGSSTPRTVPVGAGPEGLSLGRRLVWVANGDDDSVSRLDRSSAAAAGPPTPVGNKPIGIFAGRDWVWVTNSFSRTVSRIDPSSGTVAGEPVPVGKNIRSVTEGLGYTWVSSVAEDTVTRLDPKSGEVVGEPIPVGDRPKEMAVADGLLWVVNEGDNSVSRIDPKSARVVGSAIRVGSTPVGIAAGAGSLWVTNNASDTVTRIDP